MAAHSSADLTETTALAQRERGDDLQRDSKDEADDEVLPSSQGKDVRAMWKSKVYGELPYEVPSEFVVAIDQPIPLDSWRLLAPRR